MQLPNTILAITNFRNEKQPFCIKQNDRLSHIYIIGKTGSGKTTLLENLVIQDIARGRGLAYLDPHGDSVKKIFKIIGENKKQNVVYFNVPDNPEEMGYNPIRPISRDKRPLAASGILEVFKKLWDDAWGVRMEHIFRNCLMTLFDQPSATLADILRLLNDDKYRRQAIEYIENDQVKIFWTNEFERYSYRLRADAIAPIQNKVGAFLANPVLNKILTAPKENISFRKIMDEGKTILVNLSKGKLGEDASHLLGGLLMTSIGLAAFSRADSPEEKRKDFTIFADEFQNFTTLSLVNMASELRKYHVSMILAHQFIDQLDLDIRNAVIGNAGTLICFRLGPKDASFLEKEFYPIFDRHDLMNLPNHHIYLKLMIDGKPSKPFSAITLPPWKQDKRITQSMLDRSWNIC